MFYNAHIVTKIETESYSHHSLNKNKQTCLLITDVYKLDQADKDKNQTNMFSVKF